MATDSDSLSNDVLSFDFGVQSPVLAALGQITVMAADSYGYLTTVTLDVSRIAVIDSHLMIPMSGTDVGGQSYQLSPFSGGKLFVEIPENFIVGQDAQARAWEVGNISNASYLLTPMTVVTDGSGTSGADWMTGTIGDDSINAGAGDDFIEWKGGNDLVDAGAGYDMVHLSTDGGMYYSYQMDAAEVLHLWPYSYSSSSTVDAYRITKLTDVSFRIDKMQADGETVDSTMTLSNAEKLTTDRWVSINLTPYTFIDESVAGNNYIHGTPWNDEIYLTAANSLDVWAGDGRDTLVMDFGVPGYGKLELVKSGSVYVLQGTVGVDGTVTVLGALKFFSHGEADMTTGSGESAKTFSIGSVEVFQFVSGTTLYEIDPAKFTEVSFWSGLYQNSIYGTAKDDTINADALGLASNASTADDYIYESIGNDTINGGAGNDTVGYNGNKADYTITNNDGVWTVADTRAGSPDGTDTLIGVEYLSFSDAGMALAVQFYPTSSSSSGSSNSINGTGFDDQIDADALAVANPYKGSSSAYVYFRSQPIYTLGANEFSMIGTVTFTVQELANLTNLGLELWHGPDKVTTTFTVNADDIINQTGGAYTLNWIGTATQTTIPTGTIYFTYDKDGYSYNDYISGNGGNDTISGGAGNDTASYNGNRADYTITNNDGVWTVADTRAGSPDGTDTLTGIERLSFNDESLDLAIRFTPTSSSYSTNRIDGTGFDDQIDADALAVANPYKGSSSAYVYFQSQPIYTLGANEFSMIGTVTFTDQELASLTNLGLELWHGTDKILTSFTVNASEIMNQTGGAYTLHWIGTATQTTIPTGWISFSYDKEGVFSYNDYISSNGGNDLINAGSGNDTIYGNGGDDTISGGSGNDTIDGGDGNDTVVFSGYYAEYTIAREVALSRYTITDHVAGRDGTDVVTSVENFRFADGFIPTLTAFSGVVGVTDEDTAVEVTFADIKVQGNQADADGSIQAFVVKSVNGTLRIGADAATATAWNASKNNTIDATHKAYWTPAANANGTLTAFAVVAKDNTGQESLTPVQAAISVIPVKDVPVIFQPSALSFSEKVDYATGTHSLSVTSADVNGDGNSDLIVANADSNSVSVLTNKGDGTFAGKVDYGTGSYPLSVTSADVNGDGKADLVVVNWSSRSVSVLTNKGDGTFATKVDYSTSYIPSFVTTAEVNGDGKADLIVANVGGNSVSMFQNNGDGTFAGKVDYGTGSYPQSVTTADVNGDGKTDLIVANSGSYSVSVLTNKGDGTFTTKVDYATGSYPYSVTSTDVNGDEKADLIVANREGNSVSVLTNNGDGTFAAKVDYATGSYPYSVTSVDVNGDGKADLIVANSSSNSVSVLKNNGDGTFATKVDYATGDSPLSVSSSDVNSDGKADLIVANSQYNIGSVSVLTNTTHPAVTAFTELTPVHISSDIIINDPDGDTSWNGGALNVQITANAEAADSLSLATANPGGTGIWLDVAASNKLMAGTLEIGMASAASASNGDVWSFSFNANATNALVQDVARALIFNNSSSTPGTADRSITFTVTDNTLASATLVESIVISPTLSSSTPSDNALAVPIDSNIVLTFNKPVQAGKGAIVIADDSGDIRTIDVTDSSQVIFSGSTLTINPTDDLRADSLYNVHIASGVIKDLTGNVYVGISDTASLDFVTASNSVVSNDQPFYNYNGHTYQLTSGVMSWEQAESEAIAHGGHLVSINSAEENQWLLSSFAGNKAWIGLNDIQQEGVWRWTDRSSLAYTNWSSGEPNDYNGSEDTSEIYCDSTGKWNDWVGTNRQYGIIEYSSLITIIPTLTTFSGVFGAISEDMGGVEVTFSDLQTRGDASDADGTVEAFVVKSVNGTLRIGADAATATLWNASTNNTIDATHKAYWTPAANANGTLNAFDVVAEDNSGGESIVPVSVTIDVVPVNDPPAIDAWSNDTAWECTSWNYTITLGDPDPDTYHVTVNWGDGTALQIIDTTRHILNLSHTFSDNGYYTITVTADDQQSQANSVETDSFLATVNNVAPTAVVTGADRLNTGSSYTLSVGSVVDPGPDTRTGYSIDWGDGTTIAFTPADWEVIAKTFTHTFTANSAAETVRTITVNASDEDGVFVMGSKVVTVNRAPNDIYLDNARIAENSLAGTIIGTLYSADDEGWSGHEYQLLDNAGGRFVLVGNQIQVADGAVLDFETATSHTIRVSSTDQGGLSFEKEISINLTDVGPDLFISEIDTPQGVVDVDAGSSIEVFWTLATQGSEASNATWYDRIYLDNPDTPWLDRWIGDYQVSAHLPLSDGLDRIQTIQVPLDMQGTFRVVVLADAGNSVNEGATGETNNTTYGSVLFNVLNTNLQVESVTVPASGFAGREIEVQWVVKNLGNASTPVPWWYDQLYLSSDTTLDSQDIALGAVQNASYLDIGQGYTNKAKVTLPSGLEGNYHILVKTDAYQHIQEGAGEGDNVTASTVLDIQPIPLSELSDPAVVSVAAPSQALSGQSMALTYTIDNAGQADIAKNSPVWVERIYMSSDNILDGGDRLLDTQWRDFVADALPLPDGQSHFTATEKVILPVGVEGNFYFFVTVNPVGPVSNAFTFNDVAFDPTPTLVRLTPPPDLKVSDISASSPAVAGHDLTITYRVTNSGSTTTPNSGWYDSLYLSSDTALDSADIKLANLWHSGSLEPASTTDELPLSEAILRYNSGLASGYYTNSVTVRLANGLQGSWYLLASTDTNNDVFELDNANNIAAIAEAITIDSRPADLVVTEVTAPTAVQAGNSLRLSWTVKNQGIGDSGITQWTDRVVLSRDAVFGNSDDLTLGNFTHTGLLNNGQSYSSNELVVLPKEFSGPYQLFMETDAFNQVYEFDHENNNTRLMGVSVEGQPPPVIQIQVQIPADLRVTSLTAPASAASGDWFTVDYTVANTGVGRTNVDSWRDEVILSKDETLGNVDDVNLGSVYHSNRLAPNESYQGSGSFKLPIDLQGDYHVLVRTDAEAQVSEQEGENNNQSIAAGTTTINLSPTPDLLISTLQARDQGVSGQSLEVDWTVHNNGAETSGGWRQVFYLSRDGVLDRGSDIYLGYADSQMPLAAEGDATYSQLFKIPYGISGKYYLFAVVDSNNAIYERGGEGNNSTLDATPIQITPVTPVDLVAGVITVPVNAITGALASIDYTVTNQSEQAVTGQWSDSIYLSRDAVWDVGDALFTKVGISGGLDGNESYTQTAVGTMPGLIGGDYYVIVRSDIFNQIN
ncbi:MAG: hypothetical protein FDX21_07935 [Chlorobium sp.]|nr:MAG: hypothetical protein FDX21_07935 [Chlorobium sp.]